MDFSKLEPVGKANSKTPKEPGYRVKFNAAKQHFIISPALAKEINLPDNSLIQLNDPSTKSVFLAVAPGNDGVWFRAKANTVKGRSRRNEELAKALADYGIASPRLDLVKQDGLYKGTMPVYKVVPVATPAKEAPAQASKKHNDNF